MTLDANTSLKENMNVLKNLVRSSWRNLRIKRQRLKKLSGPTKQKRKSFMNCTSLRSKSDWARRGISFSKSLSNYRLSIQS